jgi:TonB family protein
MSFQPVAPLAQPALSRAAQAEGWIVSPTMPPPHPRLTLFDTLLISAVLHCLLLLLPLDLGVKPAGRPTLDATKVSVPLRVTLRSTATRQDPAPWFPQQAEQHVTALPEQPANNEQLPQPAPGQLGAETPRSISYFPLKALSKEPEAISEFTPRLPTLPGGAQGKGKLTIRIWINAAGSIDRVEILEGTMTSAYRQEVLAAFGKMAFTPGEINHLPVATWADVVIDVPNGGN